MKFKLTLLLLIITAGLVAQTENQEEKKKFGIHFKGFVKSDYWIDSRQIVGVREDLFLIYPMHEQKDINGKDINAAPIFNFSPITSRLTGVITGPDAFDAETSGVIEADFSGVTNADINGFNFVMHTENCAGKILNCCSGSTGIRSLFPKFFRM